MPYTPNPEIEKLKTERERNEAKLRYHKNELRVLKHEESELNRKARNHRIFTRGGMLESFLLRPLLLTDEQVHTILKVAYHLKEIGDLIKRFMPKVVSSIVNGISAAVSSVTQIGKNIMQGLWQGIQSMGQWIQDKIGSLFRSVINGASI